MESWSFRESGRRARRLPIRSALPHLPWLYARAQATSWWDGRSPRQPTRRRRRMQLFGRCRKPFDPCGKARRKAGLLRRKNFNSNLKLFVEIADRAGDIHSTRNAALAVFDALDDARGLAALGTVGRLRRVHYLLAVACFGNFSHDLGCFSS